MASATEPVDTFLDDFNKTLGKITDSYASTKIAIANIKGGKSSKSAASKYTEPPNTGAVPPSATNYTPYIIGGAAIIAIILIMRMK